MSLLIKKRLEELACLNEHHNVLWAQWTFDEKLITKALSSVSQIFPHYSLHDSSHSNQILTNIERILGSNIIDQLSGTDLWLLLESAYCHDLGMVVPIDRIKKDWDGEEFQKYILGVSNNGAHDLSSIAEKYIGCPVESKLNSSQWPLDAFEEVRLLLADFYRIKHAQRSEDIVNNPWGEINLSSPRNELLPARLFKALGKISSHHGLSFSDVMNLPKKEVGVGSDDAHPRYIACLLRLGDLLDLDDNRFCPVMLRTAGTLPSTTQSHIEKHLSIEHFRMDQNRVEVHAACESYEGYEATSSWFKYLEEEFNLQMKNWDDIVPDKSMGLLPTIGSLDIKLKKYELLTNEGTPKFEVDQDKMFDILKGSGLYSKPTQCIREILQNSADATLLRLWCEKFYSSKHKSIDFNYPSQEISKLLKDQYPININISKGNSNGDHVDWLISIRDQGIGIDKNNLSFLQKIGSSNKNKRRTDLLREMPLWARPSGSFGIGFQSIFLITNKVEIQSKCFFSQEAMIVNMDSPSSSGQGNIFITRQDEPYRHEVGTNLVFSISCKKVPDRFSYSFDDESVMQAIKDFDFTENNSLNIEILNLIRQISEFSKNSYIPITLNYEGGQIDLPHKCFENTKYYKDSGLFIEKLTIGNGTYASKLLFKGQLLETNISTSFVALNIDLHVFNAIDILEVNRNKIKQENIEEVNDHVNGHLVDFMKYIRPSETEVNQQYIDACIISLTPLTEFLSDSFPHSCIVELPLIDTGISTKDITQGSYVEVVIRRYESQSGGQRTTHKTIVEKNNDGLKIITDQNQGDTTLLFVFNYLIPKHFPGQNYISSVLESDGVGEYKEITIRYDKTSKRVVSDDYIKDTIEYLDSYSTPWPRSVMLCPDSYEFLAVQIEKVGFTNWARHPLDAGSKARSNLNRIMILPFKYGDNSYEAANIEHVINWTYENRLKSSTSKGEIKKSYERLTSHIQKLMS